MFTRVGLQNIGNTCFINCCIQFLKLIYPLNIALNDARILAELEALDTPESRLWLEWNELRKFIDNPAIEKIVSPKRFIFFVRHVARHKRMDSLSSDNMQGDIVEFFHFFFSQPEKKTPLDFTILWAGMQPKYISEILDIDNPSLVLSSIIENYSIIDLEIPTDLNLPQITIYDCLDDHTCSEILDGDNEWWNETTRKHQPIQKRLRFLSFPKILILALKRFTPDGGSKIRERVHYPLDNLDLNRYLAPQDRGHAIYDLYGVCYHMGMLQGGHYTSAIRDPFTNAWSYYDDEKYDKIRDLNMIVSEHAYCLLYIMRK
jgi:ubiquitin C-terminal hydrolase